MEKNNINRLLHVFVPFVIMVMIQNLLRLLWGRIDFEGTTSELISFVIASAAAIIFCRVSGEALIRLFLPFRTTDANAMETPASALTSFKVG